MAKYKEITLILNIAPEMILDAMPRENEQEAETADGMEES